MAIQLIAMDLDGTLLREDHITVSERNRKALRLAAAKGIQLVLASGRTWSLLRFVSDQVPEAQYALISNGAAGMELKRQERIFSFDFPEQAWRTMLALLRRYEAIFETYCDGRSYLERRMADKFSAKGLPEAFMERLRESLTVVDRLEDVLEGHSVEKVNAFAVPKQNHEPLLHALQETGLFDISSAIIGNMEINYSGVNKAAGLRRLCEQLHIAPENVMAFGDATNDLDMLRWAGWSFAMGNAHPLAKQAARYETASNEEDGVAQAIERYAV